MLINLFAKCVREVVGNMSVDKQCYCLLSRIALASSILLGLNLAALGQVNDLRNAKETIGDRLYLWGHPAGVYNTSYLKGFPPSKIEPVDAARLMGVKNMYFIRYEGNPAVPFVDYYRPLQTLDRVMWSLTGAAGATSEEEREAAFQLAADNKNVVGFIMDDFFHEDIKEDNKLAVDLPMKASLSPEQLKAIRDRLAIGNRRLRLSVVVYTNQIDLRAMHHLQFVDEITLWTSSPKQLVNLGSNLARLEQVAGDKSIVLGCYMFDFNDRKAMSAEDMKYQLGLANKWLQQGRIDGVILLGTPVCDVDLAAVTVAEEWVVKVRDLPLTSGNGKP